jgi:hypothetical protein
MEGYGKGEVKAVNAYGVSHVGTLGRAFSKKVILYAGGLLGMIKFK